MVTRTASRKAFTKQGRGGWTKKLSRLLLRILTESNGECDIRSRDSRYAS